MKMLWLWWSPAVDAELKSEANSVGDQPRYKSMDAVNTANVDAQCESAKDVQSKEDEANVEHVEAKEVATVSLGRSIVRGEAKSLHQANDEARMEALEDPTAIGVVFSPPRPLGVPDNHPESNYLTGLVKRFRTIATKPMRLKDARVNGHHRIIVHRAEAWDTRNKIVGLFGTQSGVRNDEGRVLRW